MSASHPKIRLKIIPHSTRGPFLKAPPILVASDHTVDFTCGVCGTVLMHAENDQVHNLNILCTECGSFNSTDIDAV